MAKIKKQIIALGQVSVGTTSATIASLLGRTTDEECLFPGIIIQADPANSNELYLGGVNSSGVADSAQAKSLKLVANGGFAFEADMNGGDEDQELYDLRQISLSGPIGGLLANITVVKIGSVNYNG